MGKTARIINSEAVAMLGRALFKLDENVRRTLDDLDVQVRRAALWFEQDRHFYWKAETRRSFDRISEARVALEQARSKKLGDHEPTCYVERKALARAKERSEEVQTRVKQLRGAMPGLNRAVAEFQGTIVRLRSWFETDLPRALAALERMQDALEAYSASGKPAAEIASSAELAAILSAASVTEKGTEDAPPAVSRGESPESAGASEGDA